MHLAPLAAAPEAHVPSSPTLAVRRRARGYGEMEFLPLAAARGAKPPNALTERYARLIEAQIHSAPSDWLWSHKRWKLKKSLLRTTRASRAGW